jgi:hypothetical protein
MKTIHLTDLAATWERCAIEVTGDTLQPAPPFTPYNLFDFYFPAGQAPQRDQRSLPYEFLRIDASNVEAIVDFCERFGVLRIIDEGKGPSIIDALAEESDPEVLARYPQWSVAGARLARYGDVPAPPGGYRELTVAEFQEAQTHLREAVTWVQAWQAASSRAEAAKARFNVRQRIDPPLRLVYPRPVWDEQEARWVMGWDIRSLEAAMYLMLLFDLQGPGRIQTCPRCQTLFLGDRARTRFCSLQCQNAQNVSQFRERTRRPSGKRVAHTMSGGPRKRITKRKARR